MKNLHEKIVREILPGFAEKLKKEAIISEYDRHPFKIPILKDHDPLKINPDLVIHLPNGQTVLVEIANPRDPKRFLGEIIYPHFLWHYEKIAKTIIFVLHSREFQKKHDRGFDQIFMLAQIFDKLPPYRITSWPPDEETAYYNLKFMLKRFLNNEKLSSNDVRKEGKLP